MKLVKEHINERFVEDSDPIKDMGIGMNTFENIKKGDIIIRTKQNIKFKNIRIGDYCLVNKTQHGKNTLILWLSSFTMLSSLRFYRRQLFLKDPQLKYDGVFYAEPYRSWEKCFKVLQPKELKQFESVNEK